MDLVLCHTTADFDTLGAAVGVTYLRPGSRIVLAGGVHPTVQRFLSLWRDEYPLIERRAVNFDQVKSLTVVDAYQRDRLTPLADWLQQADAQQLPLSIYDHHSSVEGDSAAPALSSALSEGTFSDWLSDWSALSPADVVIEAVGAATTLVVERLQQQPSDLQVQLSAAAATVMALGIHSDTGSLTFEQSTVRDAAALTWLMAQGANQQIIAEYHEPGLSAQLQALLPKVLELIQQDRIRGHRLGWVRMETPAFVPGLSGLAEHVIRLLRLDTFLLYAQYGAHSSDTSDDVKAVLIGRSRPNARWPSSHVNLQPIFEAVGGGGHPQAASAILSGSVSEDRSHQENGLDVAFDQVLTAVRSQIPSPVTAQTLMSSPVRTVLPDSTVESAQKILLRYGHTGLCVVDSEGALVGIVSRRDLDVALRHGLGHAPVTGCMTTQVKTAQPDTTIFDLHQTMVTYDIGRLPVLQGGELVGMVTRTDLLRQLQGPQSAAGHTGDFTPPPEPEKLYQSLRDRLPTIWPALMLISAIADEKNWALYLVGGAVRDLLLSELTGEAYPLTDIDLVVDGAEAGAGVLLAEAIQSTYPQVEIQVHGQFQTAELRWPQVSSPVDPSVDTSAHSAPLLLDIATARTEFYPYPAANPEVESSTIRQDLYRRDFTINAMALRLNGDRKGDLLDFFGGWIDLQQQTVRVLHANSFIEDPTRIFRAARFAVRFGFDLDPQTEQFIRYAVRSGLYDRALASGNKTPALQARLKAELRYLLQSPQWSAALVQLDHLGALSCLHGQLALTPELERQLRRMDRWLNKFDVDQPRWLMLLLLIIVQLPPTAAAKVAQVLQLDDKAINRVKTLPEKEQRLLGQLAGQVKTAPKPSYIYQLFHPLERADLLLIADRHPYTLGRWIWQYIVQLSQVPPLINGATLKRLGYKPGPQFREILTAVHQLKLDGELMSAKSAEAHVTAQYPKDPPVK
ncbi:MAG: CBS domain-containing protein [Cyanobacteria bacterium J06606_4]